MRICLISVEIFAWGKYGGFGRATRIIGRELAKRGVEVTAVVPRRGGQNPVEELDGMRVLSFKPRDLLSVSRLFRQADADVYHSEEPSLGTYLAMLQSRIAGFEIHVFLRTSKRLKKVMPLAVFICGPIHYKHSAGYFGNNILIGIFLHLHHQFSGCFNAMFPHHIPDSPIH